MKKIKVSLIAILVLVSSIFIMPVSSILADENVEFERAGFIKLNNRTDNNISRLLNSNTFDPSINGFEFIVKYSNSNNNGFAVASIGWNYAKFILSGGGFTYYNSSFNTPLIIQEHLNQPIKYLYYPVIENGIFLNGVLDISYFDDDLKRFINLYTFETNFTQKLDQRLFAFVRFSDYEGYMENYLYCYFYSFYLFDYTEDIPLVVDYTLPYVNQDGLYGIYSFNENAYHGFDNSYSGEPYEPLEPDEPEPIDPDNPPYIPPVVVVNTFEAYEDTDISDFQSWLERANAKMEQDLEDMGGLREEIYEKFDVVNGPIKQYLEAFDTGFFSGSKFFGDTSKEPYSYLIDYTIDNSNTMTWVFNASCGVAALVILIGGLI